MDLIIGFDWASLVLVWIRQSGRARLGGRCTLMVSEHPESGSDPPIGFDREGVLQDTSMGALFYSPECIV